MILERVAWAGARLSTGAPNTRDTSSIALRRMTQWVMAHRATRGGSCRILMQSSGDPGCTVCDVSTGAESGRVVSTLPDIIILPID